MAKQLSKTGISTGLDIEAHHVTQSVDAFTGVDEYDITLSGSFVVSGSSNRTTIIDNQYKVEGSDFTITGSNDIVLDADGSQIYMKDGGTTRLTFNLDSTPELDIVGDFTIDASGDLDMESGLAGNMEFRSGERMYLISNVDASTGDGNFNFGYTNSYPNVIEFETYNNGGNITISSSLPGSFLTASLGFYNFGNFSVIRQEYGSENMYISNRTGSGADYGKINIGGEQNNDSFIFFMEDRTNIESQPGGGLKMDGNLLVGANAYKTGGGSWSATSDSRLKENIVTASIDTCYDGVKNLSLKYFKWKEEVSQYPQPDKHQLGWIAQDVETVFPHAVQESDFLTWSTYTGSVAITGSEENTTLHPGKRYQDPLAGSELIENRKILDADQITKMMFGAIQKLQQKVEALEAQISGSN